MGNKGKLGVGNLLGFVRWTRKEQKVSHELVTLHERDPGHQRLEDLRSGRQGVRTRLADGWLARVLKRPCSWPGGGGVRRLALGPVLQTHSHDGLLPAPSARSRGETHPSGPAEPYPFSGRSLRSPFTVNVPSCPADTCSVHAVPPLWHRNFLVYLSFP